MKRFEQTPMAGESLVDLFQAAMDYPKNAAGLKLVEAVLDAQDVYEAYSDDLLSDERAADEIRCCRSRIRMYAKDAEFLPNPDGSPASDAWGSLDDFIPWRWRP